jgi:hypothetical protein
MKSDSAPPFLVTVTGWGDEKQLVATADVATGAAMLAEYPIAFVETQAGEDGIGPWLLLEGILSSPAMFERVVAEDLKLTKWPLSREDETRLEHLAGKYKRNPKKLAQLYHRVAANNLHYSQHGVTGYGLWPMLSRANHSCDPNAKVCATPPHPLADLLIATRPVAKGEAICWNYLADEAFLRLDWRARNAQLFSDFQFLCRCARCMAERPAEAAGWSRQEASAYLRGPRP